MMDYQHKKASSLLIKEIIVDFSNKAACFIKKGCFRLNKPHFYCCERGFVLCIAT